jgi:hypothetical protein
MIKLIKNIKKLVSSLKYLITFFELLLLKSLIYNKNKISSISKNNLKNNYFKMVNIKKSLQDKIFKMLKKNISSINILNIKSHQRFGNYLICLKIMLSFFANY